MLPRMLRAISFSARSRPFSAQRHASKCLFFKTVGTVRGVIQGWSQPEVFLPRLVDLMMEGKLPVECMMIFYDLADINHAAADAEAGRTIKHVQRMPQ